MQTPQGSKNSFVIKTSASHKQLIITSPKLGSHRHFTKILPNQEHSNNFRKLIQLHDKQSKQTIYHRCRSSQSTLEGTLNKRCQQIFLSLPYQSTKYHKNQFYKQKWRKLILCVQAVLFFFKVALVEYKIRRSSPPKMTITHLGHHCPYPESPTNRKKKKQKVQQKSVSFGEKLETLILLQKLKVDTTKRKSYFREFKIQDIRINRLISQKAMSCHSLHSTIDNSKQLPSLTKLESLERPSGLSIHNKKFTLKFKKIT